MRRYNIMLVDDEANVINSLLRLLRNDNYNIITANSASEALEKLKEYSVSLVLTDQRMPKTSGLDLLREVKRLYPDTLRIIVTGYTDLDVMIKAINEGEVYRFITKPWNDEELKIIIRQALNHYDLMQDNRILLQMVKKQKDAFYEIKSQYPDVMNLPKIKEGAYVIDETKDSLDDFIKKYFPEQKDKQGNG